MVVLPFPSTMTNSANYAALLLLGYTIGCGASSTGDGGPGDGGSGDSGVLPDSGTDAGPGGEVCSVSPGGTGAPLGDGGPCQSSSNCNSASYCHLPVIHCTGYDFWVGGFESQGDCRPKNCGDGGTACASDEFCNLAGFCDSDPCPSAITGVTCLCNNPPGNWPYPSCSNPPPGSQHGGCPSGCGPWYTPTGAIACKCPSCPDPDAGYLTNGC
jgi:hypothetical protein